MNSSDSVQKMLVPVMLQPIEWVFNDYEGYLEQSYSIKPGAREQLEKARRHVDLLVSGAVALQNQEDPGELARLREQVGRQQKLAREYGHQIAEEARRHKAEVAELQRKLEALELTNIERIELGKLRKERAKSDSRLREAREALANAKKIPGGGTRQVVETLLIRALATLAEEDEVAEGPLTQAQKASVRVILGNPPPGYARAEEWERSRHGNRSFD